MQHKFYKLLVWGLAFNVLIIAGIYIFSQNRKTQRFKLDPIQRIFSDFHYSEVKNGRKCWELEARSANRLKNNVNKVVLSQIKAVFYPQRGKPVYLKANTGILDMNTKNVTLKKNVHIWQKKGYNLTTQEIFYVQKKHLLYTDIPVLIVGKGLRIRANKMRFFLKQDRLVFLGNVKGCLHKETLIKSGVNI